MYSRTSAEICLCECQFVCLVVKAQFVRTYRDIYIYIQPNTRAFCTHRSYLNDRDDFIFTYLLISQTTLCSNLLIYYLQYGKRRNKLEFQYIFKICGYLFYLRDRSSKKDYYSLIILLLKVYYDVLFHQNLLPSPSKKYINKKLEQIKKQKIN